MDKLMLMQIKQESVGLYKELTARNVKPLKDIIV